MSHLGSTAKRLITSSAAMAFSSRIVMRDQPRIDDALANHIFDVEHIVWLSAARRAEPLLVGQEMVCAAS